MSAQTPLFLERQNYRRRRMMDAARLLPILGAVMLTVPILWPVPEMSPETAAAATAEPVLMSRAIIYIFAVWAVLIVLSGYFSLHAANWSQTDSPHGPDHGE